MFCWHYFANCLLHREHTSVLEVNARQTIMVRVSFYFRVHCLTLMSICFRVSQKVFRSFRSKHDDYIHDIAYDFYGRRLATCSSDQKVKIWDTNPQGEWALSAEFKVSYSTVQYSTAPGITRLESIMLLLTLCHIFFRQSHSVSVHKVAWAHPEFGPVLASCSADRQVFIYEEQGVSRSVYWCFFFFSRNVFCSPK